jgi:hypothetical protein
VLRGWWVGELLRPPRRRTYAARAVHGLGGDVHPEDGTLFTDFTNFAYFTGTATHKLLVGHPQLL